MCTAVSVTSGEHYFGRNLDYEYAYDGKITITPRNYGFCFTNGEKQSCHYAMMGMALPSDGYPLYFDAFNEAGLCMAGLNFPGNAHYEKEKGGKDNIASFEFIPFVLAQCKNVSEAAKLLQNINITDKSFNSEMKPSPLHWIISDKEKSLSAEQTKDGFKLHENTVGVLTNSPTFDKQLFNLTNYMSVSSDEPKNVFSDMISLMPYSRGMGTLGLPGDYTSMSRFVRACFVKLNSVYGKTENERVSQFFHVLNSVSHPKGCVKIKEDFEITHYSSCCNTDKGIYYYTTYYNSSISGVDLYKENLDGNSLVIYDLIKEQKFNIYNQAFMCNIINM